MANKDIHIADNPQELIQKIEKLWDAKISKKDTDYVNSWCNFLFLDEELILYAAELTMKAINKPSLPYMDAILHNWKNRGTLTVDAAKEEQRRYLSCKKKQSGNESADSKTEDDNSESVNDTISKTELISFIRSIQEDMPKYMQSKAEKAGFINACCQIATFLEHK